MQQIVSIVIAKNRPWHAALIGAGGIGKSSISKAILNDRSVAQQFEVRIFVTYDGIDASAVTYQLFLERISTALALTNPDAPAALRFLGSKKALLVIDNAETFKYSGDADMGRILQAFDDIGAQDTTRIVFTSRSTDIIPQNLRCERITVSGLSLEASCKAFTAVYRLEPLTSSVVDILKSLDCHPLSINLLAHAAAMNEWRISDICDAWSTRWVKVLDYEDSKYRSLRVTIEISIASFQDSKLVLKILRAIAFLPQGIYLDDLPSLFPSVPDISQYVAAVQRSSLIYRSGDRVTMLAPIRMYISDEYNHTLSFKDKPLSTIRGHYHKNLSQEAYDFVEREHGNIDRLMHFDMTSPDYRAKRKIHLCVLDKADDFLFCTSVQLTSLWPLLVHETQENSFSRPNSLARLISLCLIRICWIDYNRNDDDEALGKLKVVEAYCREHSLVCNERLVRCLRLKSYIFRDRGNLKLATKALEEGSSIARDLQDLLDEASLNQSLAGVLLLQGKVTEATSLYLSAQQSFKANNEYRHLITLLIFRSDTSISQNDFTNARLFLDKAMELDQLHDGGRLRLNILYWKASCEGWAGDVAAALRILQEATEVEVSSDKPHFKEYLGAIRGRAYYEAKMGQFDDAGNSIACAIELTREDGRDLNNDFISALIANFSGESGKAISMIQTILDQYSGNDRHITAIYHRTLAEILIIEGRHGEDRAQFAQAKAICDETGISPKNLYVNKEHWFSLPVEYYGWVRFLADTV